MRDRIWFNLVNVRFQIEYIRIYHDKVDLLSRGLSIFLAITSASSVAAWAFWQKYPNIWAIIIGVSQIIIASQPYLPLIKNCKELLDHAFTLETLYLKYERLWFDLEIERIDYDEAENRFYDLREKEVDIDKSHSALNYFEIGSIRKKSHENMITFLNLNFHTNE